MSEIVIFGAKKIFLYLPFIVERILLQKTIYYN